jgi:hypothetical protein
LFGRARGLQGRINEKAAKRPTTPFYENGKVKPARAAVTKDLLNPAVPIREDESDWFNAQASNSHPQAGLLAQDNFQSPSHRFKKNRQWHAD